MVHDELPSQETTVLVLKQLIGGDITREQASAWALPWVMRLDDIEDRRLHKTLTDLGAADLPSTDRAYLYNHTDFIAWLEELIGSRDF